MTKTTALTDIIETQAKIAMPEMVSIFLSKYETDLYEKKTNLNAIIKGIKKEIDEHVKTTEKSVSFAEYEKMGIKELNIICVISDTNINWEKEKATCAVTVKNKKDPDSDNYYNREITKDISKPVRKSFVTKYHKLVKDLDDRKEELSGVVMQITDMSRKERQIKGRISEMRLKEQGLEQFINSPDMLKLIKID